LNVAHLLVYIWLSLELVAAALAPVIRVVVRLHCTEVRFSTRSTVQLAVCIISPIVAIITLFNALVRRGVYQELLVYLRIAIDNASLVGFQIIDQI